ncbi:hypothetical protein [Paenibacillus apiarius]|uniref:Uncharacterized protein n=1 Tax=Paenibacillus apiarius TaxID=46240 RepID=A0ABT4E144_9BACL|nr:hypothetical protein [Paenibacillus apiarius]MBN3522931.1 hypothetical protein [Paenibacillus apiarius]MCY9514916.1 hypothetical protein [Paenibacillus apiarius]MCY9523332.1 hypothetical protein [Paenibacillus apiarius]MCY9554160.1 hypothetical protein [Paenibacillus apiarius]MCY9559430.1 hypothetical protein [Paenibacillus apiarius]
MNKWMNSASGGRRRWKHAVYIALVLAMLLVVLPTISLKEGLTPAVWFGIVWSAFALLVISAHLHRLLRVDEETERRLKRIKQEKVRLWESRLTQRIERMK